jgi:hypothetical protein
VCVLEREREREKERGYFLRSGGWPDLLMLKTLREGKRERERERERLGKTLEEV